MVLNNGGQQLMVGLMIAVVIIVFALALAVPLAQHMRVVMANNTDTTQGLDCSNTTIDKYNQAACIATDLTLPYFVLGVIGIAGLIVGARLLLGGS